MNDCNWNGELTQYFNIFENRDDCKCLSQRNTVPLKVLDHCKWGREIMKVPFKYALNRNICQIHCI